MPARGIRLARSRRWYSISQSTQALLSTPMMSRACPEIAVVVPSLNQAPFLAAAVRSVASQRGVSVRLALLDGGSTDDTPRIVAALRLTLDLYRSGPDGGQTRAINAGMRELLARHTGVEYVAWLNSDDVLFEDGLRVMATRLDSRPWLVAVAGRGAAIDERGGVTGEIATAPFSPAVFARRCTICQPATLVRRSAWERVGGLDERLEMCFDYDLWWRLAALGEIGYCGERLVAGSRDHAETKTRTRRAQYFREAMTVVARHTGSVPWHWHLSEALEREAGWRPGERPGVPGTARAAARAAWSYARQRRRPS
jgi:GT2 family glycosyltransferase